MSCDAPSSAVPTVQASKQNRSARGDAPARRPTTSRTTCTRAPPASHVTAATTSSISDSSCTAPLPPDHEQEAGLATAATVEPDLAFFPHPLELARERARTRENASRVISARCAGAAAASARRPRGSRCASAQVAAVVARPLDPPDRTG
ncbi:MAG: hypothetical protein BGO98_29085 [Myxococcales bacterium 68-20]|nr:MAG: hypothetical protein BGO98_29085 [Myxococcales bacterium 68-20]